MVNFFKALIFKLRLRRAIREADRLRDLNSRKYYVINIAGRPVVVSKRRIQQLAAQGFYHPGITSRDIQAMALYKTK